MKRQSFLRSLYDLTARWEAWAEQQRQRSRTASPKPFYLSRMRPRACTEETLRLCNLRRLQRRRQALAWAVVSLLGLLAGALAFWLLGEWAFDLL